MKTLQINDIEPNDELVNQNKYFSKLDNIICINTSLFWMVFKIVSPIYNNVSGVKLLMYLRLKDN
jgi:hypothetical protein